jgi:hypothetical protein
MIHGGEARRMVRCMLDFHGLPAAAARVLSGRSHE